MMWEKNPLLKVCWQDHLVGLLASVSPCLSLKGDFPFLNAANLN